jgi:hypothetical protein
MTANGWRYGQLGISGDFLQVTRKVKAGYTHSHTNETLINYTAC